MEKNGISALTAEVYIIGIRTTRELITRKGLVKMERTKRMKHKLNKIKWQTWPLIIQVLVWILCLALNDNYAIT
jgi:hypothetical protein